MDDERQRRLMEMGELVGAVLHELRNPLGVIESSVYLMRQKPDDTERRDKHLLRIDEQVQHAQRVIHGLLGLLSDQPLDLEPIAVETIATDALSTITQRVPMKLDLDGASVRAERTLLRQVIHNLVDNAQREATSWVSIVATRIDDRVQIAVEDDGPGVPDAIAAQLFQPLTTTRPGGVGLGLALSRRIVERHGGTLRYERGDAGARFVLELPIA